MKREPLIKVCVRELGPKRGGMAAAAIVSYAIATADLGHVPTAVEYAEWFGVSERTAWRHRERCRDVFGDRWRDVVGDLANELRRREDRSRASALSALVAA